jgi:tetratricopeptide (TPR) repeat protein
MQQERDELVKHVFPKLRELCESRGVVWGEVDLRWGITDKQRDEGLVLPICLQEIRECRPYFIGLLGERYGFVPEELDPILVQREPWLVDYAGRSVTELEIVHGVLADPQMADHAFFYFRDRNYHAHEPDFGWGPGNEEILRLGTKRAWLHACVGRERLAALKERICDSGLPVRDDYADPRALGQLVLDDLTAVINRVFPTGSQPTPLERERRLHEAFARNLADVYIARPQLFDLLDTHADGDEPPIAVLGVAGVGKSALLANWALRRIAAERDAGTVRDSDTFTLIHLVAASPDGANWEKVARRIIAEFEDRFGLQSSDLVDLGAVRGRLDEVLHSVPANQRAILIIDGLNQFEGRDGALDLVWLPARVAPNVRLVVSTLPGRPLDEWLRRGWSTLTVQSLNHFEKAALINDYLKQYAKLLPGDLVEDIAAAPQTGNPLFLRLMLEELRVYGDHLTLRRRLDELLGADAVPSLYKLILSRWEHDYDRDRPALVAESMVLLWASRRGLSESELRDLLGSGMQPLRHDLWSALYLAARQTLVNHDGIISFAHEYARSAVENRYLTDQLVQGAAHMRLAEYFLATYNRNLPPGFEELHRSGKVSEAARTLRAHRLFEELPWQVAHAGEWEKLAELFGGAVFFGFAVIRDKFEVCRYWRDIERHIPGAALRAFASVIASPGRDFDMSWHVAVLLEHLGYRRECAEIFRQLDADGSGSMSASDRAGIAVNLASAALKAGNPHVALTMDAAVAQTYSSGADGYAAAALRNKAAALFKADQHREALRALDEAETIYRRLDDPVGVASCLTVRAPILDMLGEHDAASAAFEQQQRIYRESEDLDSLAVALSNHANMLSRQGDSAAAEALLIDALAVAQRLGDDRRRARVYEVRARTRLGRDWPGCLADLDECERLARAMGERATEASAIYMRALVKFVFHEWESAESLATRAARIRRELNDERGVAQCTELAGRAIEQRVAEFRHTNSPRGS